MLVADLDAPHALLLGAIVGSTDAAAVFSLLRQAGLRLRPQLTATLEMESGLNDPMAVFLVLALIGVIQRHETLGSLLVLLLRQAGFGALVGLVGGRVVAWLLRRLPVRVEQGGLLSLLIVSAGLTLFALAGLVGGSGFLAVYLFGLRLRALAEAAANAASSALDGFAWAAQASMFLLLGLFVTPVHLLQSLPIAVAATVVLVFIARPLAVWLCLSPWPFSGRERLFVGWVGLRGAVPIVLALFPVLSNLPGSERYFNIAFAVVLVSLLLQGTTLGPVARWLRVAEPPPPPPEERPVLQGRLTLDADLPLQEVFDFFRLPPPEQAGPTLRDWMTDALAKGHAEGDSVDWHGAHFRVLQMHDGRIQRVGVALASSSSPERTDGG
jgi:cell volume regulation protein A